MLHAALRRGQSAWRACRICAIAEMESKKINNLAFGKVPEKTFNQKALSTLRGTMGTRLERPMRRRYTNRTNWTLSQWLDKEWKDGVPQPTQAFFVASSPIRFPLPPRPEAAPMSPTSIKALIYMKGWMLKDLAAHWRMSPENLSRIIRSVNRSPVFDEAVLGLPIRRHGALLASRPRVKLKLIMAVSE